MTAMDNGNVLPPCGRCREMLFRFGPGKAAKKESQPT